MSPTFTVVITDIANTTFAQWPLPEATRIEVERRLSQLRSCPDEQLADCVDGNGDQIYVLYFRLKDPANPTHLHTFAFHIDVMVEQRLVCILESDWELGFPDMDRNTPLL